MAEVTSVESSAHRRSLIELNLAVLLWGGTALFAKWIALPAFQITGWRSVVAGAALGLLVWGRGYGFRVANGREALFMGLLGLSLTGHWVTYFHSIQVSTVAVGILALHTYPVITALAEPLVFGHRLRAADVGVAIVVLIGIGILVPEFSLDSATTRGVIWGVLSAGLFAARNLISKWFVRIYPGSKLMFFQMVVCAGLLVPVAIAWGQPTTGRAAGQVLLLGLLFTALPHTLFTNSLQRLSAKTVSVIATLLPIYGTLFAALLFQEIPSRRTLAGGAIILAAVAYETWVTVRAAPAPRDLNP